MITLVVVERLLEHADHLGTAVIVIEDASISSWANGS